MVVTEDPALRSTLVTLFTEWRLQAFAAADGVDALRQIYHVSPEIIVADLDLGNCAGFELLPFLRRRFPEIGVVCLVRERVPRKEQLDAIIADDIVPINPFDPGVLEQSLVGVRASYPFRQEFEADDVRASGSTGRRCDTKMHLAP